MGAIAQLPVQENFSCVAGSPLNIRITTAISGAVWADLSAINLRVYNNGVVIAAGTYGPTLNVATTNLIQLSWSATQTAAMASVYGSNFSYQLDCLILGAGPYPLMAGTLSVLPQGSPGDSTTISASLAVTVGTVAVNLSVLLGATGSGVIPVYATTAARDTAIPAPTEGLYAYTSDFNITWYYSGTAWVNVSGTAICTSGTRPAAPYQGLEIYQTDIHTKAIYSGTAWSSIGPVDGAWNTYTPTLTNITLGNGTLTGSQMRVGRLIHFQWKLLFGSTTTMGTSPKFAPPVAMAASGWGDTFYGVGSDATGSRSRLVTVQNNTTDCFISYMDATATPVFDNTITATIPFTWAVNDYIQFSGSYEAAADA